MNLNINKDDSSINDFLFCWDIFQKRPNKITLHQTYLTSKFKVKIEKFDKENIFTEILPSDDEFIINERTLVKINDNIFMSYVSLDKTEENSISTDIYFLYKESSDHIEIEKIINEISECAINYEQDDIEKLNNLTLNNGILDIEPISNDDLDFHNMESFYNKKTFKDVNKMIKSIKSENFGLNILYGERGTGKTSIIKYVSSKLDNVLIYIPVSLIETTINNPEFSKFLRRFHNPVLVIDDCETILSDFFSKSNYISANLIQMVDGLNSLRVNVLTIFNSNLDDIDVNILEANSLLNVVEFRELESEEVNKLSTQIGLKNKTKNKAKLIDIIKGEKRNNNKIGFF